MLRMHKLDEQCDMLTPVPPRRSKMFIKWQTLRKKDPPPRKKPKERLHIWQKIDRVKELNCLEDYYWFYEEWDLINKKFMQMFGKTFPELMMERMHMTRIKKENFEIIVGSRKYSDDEISADMWEKTLREYFWEPTPGAPPKPPWEDEGRPKKPDDTKLKPLVFERIGHPDRDNPVIEFFKDRWAHTLKRRSDWGDWEWFCFRSVANLAKVEPHYPDFTGLLILGKRLRRPLPQPPKRLICIEPTVIKKKLPDVAGPAALLSPTYHFFVNQTGDQTTKSVVLENVGETVLFYTWERRPMEAIITTPKVVLGKHITECRAFAIMNGSGSVLAGEKKTFTFRFKSDVAGVFLESWVIRIAPRLPARWSLDPILLKGVALSEDHFAKLREKLSRVLYYREMMSGIDEFFVDTLNRAAKKPRPTEEIRNAEYMYAHEAFDFLQKNLSMEPPIYYVPSLYKKLEDLAKLVEDWAPPPPPPPLPPPPAPAPAAKAPAGKATSSAPAPVIEPKTPAEEFVEPPWDGSISTISSGIELVTNSKVRARLRGMLNVLIEAVQIPPHQTALLHTAIYRILRDVTSEFPECIDGVPPEFGRPMAEQLMNNFYEKYELQRLEAAEKAQAERDADPEMAEAQMMEALLDQINLENPPLNEISLQTRLDNQEMLEYCFKWLHIMTELRCFTRHGFNDYEEQVHREQKQLNEFIDDKIAEISQKSDETYCWDVFGLERSKQELVKEEKHLIKTNS